MPNTEAYDRIIDNPFIRTTQENLATFSIDVDTASYANVRRFLNQNQLPPRDAVRIEELVNYFNYDYAQPTGNAPIAPNMEVAAAPWNPANRLVRIGIKAREVNANRRPPSNLVFLIDVSGSMNTPEKLPLVKAGLNMLVERLGENDIGLDRRLRRQFGTGARAYQRHPQGSDPAGDRQPATRRLDQRRLRNSARLQPGDRQLPTGGVNRVILMTDGDFNVGVTNQGDLTRLIEERAKSGVFLSVLGFGMGNYKDSTLEKLADQGNGNYAYIDNITEARKVLVEEMSGTLVTVAKDVKIQVDFNPAQGRSLSSDRVRKPRAAHRRLQQRCEGRGRHGRGTHRDGAVRSRAEGWRGSGPVHRSVEIHAACSRRRGAEPQRRVRHSNEMLTLRVRYKQPDADTSTRMDVPLVDRGRHFARATADFRFAASVARVRHDSSGLARTRALQDGLCAGYR